MPVAVPRLATLGLARDLVAVDCGGAVRPLYDALDLGPLGVSGLRLLVDVVVEALALVDVERRHVLDGAGATVEHAEGDTAVRGVRIERAGEGLVPGLGLDVLGREAGAICKTGAHGGVALLVVHAHV